MKTQATPRPPSKFGKQVLPKIKHIGQNNIINTDQIKYEDTYTHQDSPTLGNESRQYTPSGWAQTPEHAPSFQASRVGTIGSRRFT